MSPQAMTMRIGELSRRVGVSTHVLRAWESRYELLRPVRSAGGYRLYGPADERRVRAVLDLRAKGVSAAEACRTVLRTERAALANPDQESFGGLTPEELEAALTELMRCTRSFDEAGAQVVIDRLITAVNLETFVRRVLFPLLQWIGEDWAQGTLSVANEHFASQMLRRRLSALSGAWSSGSGPVAILACPEGEDHDIPLLCLGILMGRRGWSVRYLGGNTPLSDLVRACQSLRPQLLVLSSIWPKLLEGVVPDLAPLAGDLRIALGGRGATEAVAAKLGAELLPFDLVEAAEILNDSLRETASGQ